MNAFLSLGRWFFAIPFAISGLFHFMNTQALADMVPTYMPAKTMFVYLTGGALIAGSVSIVTGKYDKLAAILLAVFLLLMAGMMHLPGAMGYSPGREIAMAMMLKDLSLAGACMMYAHHYAKDRSLAG